ncbi:MAG: rRNA maturation RNase YbeY [Oscillospiraceae bacterium]|nr:rRNA maturation RNase YbeY [Oscillospiraceae bacterium]
MSEHKIYARHYRTIKTSDRLLVPLIKRCILHALRVENVSMPCEISVLITDDENIRILNREHRGLDETTDVLSFPMLEYSDAGWDFAQYVETDPETGRVVLGDIVLCAKRVDIQAVENEHSRERETAYLTVHSILHLLGYDHIDEGEDKKLMREKEEAILNELKIDALWD